MESAEENKTQQHREGRCGSNCLFCQGAALGIENEKLDRGVLSMSLRSGQKVEMTNGVSLMVQRRGLNIRLIIQMPQEVKIYRTMNFGAFNESREDFVKKITELEAIRRDSRGNR